MTFALLCWFAAGVAFGVLICPPYSMVAPEVPAPAPASPGYLVPKYAPHERYPTAPSDEPEPRDCAVEGFAHPVTRAD